MKRRTWLCSGMVVGVIGMSIWAAQVSAQPAPPPAGAKDQPTPPPAPPPPAERQRSPEEIDREIERLQAQDPDSPRLKRLMQLRKRMETDQPGGRGRHGQGGPEGMESGEGNFEGPGLMQFTPEEIREYLDKHPKLQEMFDAGKNGPAGPDHARGFLHARFGKQLSECIRAEKDGNTELEGALTDALLTQGEIFKKVRAYRDLPADSPEQGKIKDEIVPLVRQHIEQEFKAEDLKLQALQKRLDKQREKLQKDRTDVESLVQKRLDRLLKAKEAGEKTPPAGAAPSEPQNPPTPPAPKKP